MPISFILCRFQRFKPWALLLSLSLLSLGAVPANAAAPSFGSAEDVSYAAHLWQALEDAKLVGESAKPLEPFFGGAAPHGHILELADQMLIVEGHLGFVVVKKNYEGEGVSVESVSQDRARFLDSYTVMFQREVGYDIDNQNWYWVKYQANGELFNKTLPSGPRALAGRVAKADKAEDSGGCIYCHRSAGGGDYIFYPEISHPDAKP